ncbi:MAG: hypothetical protein KDK12_12750 [Rhodobacteraceae bacterium]|nr:hypothetical protein [Paracoccaceae bacterium]
MLTVLSLIVLLLRALPAPAPEPHFPIAPACDMAGEGCRLVPAPGKALRPD